VELDDAAWTMLHELRLRGMVQVDDQPVVELLVTRGFAVHKRNLVAITAEGRAAHATWARCVEGSPTEGELRVAYERFLPLNRDLLRLCHDWQVHAGAPNDHTHAEYDWSVIDRLHALHERTSPVTRAMARSMERFSSYRTRLRDALRRVDEGDTDWFTSPRLDSYHTVWMQLHEDVLLALGLDRSAEPEVRA
jgi:hypothetical protein